MHRGTIRGMWKHALIACAALVAGAEADAQVFRCPGSNALTVQQKPCAGGERVDVKPYRASYSNVSKPGPSVPDFIQPPTPKTEPAPEGTLTVKTAASGASGVTVTMQKPPAWSCDNPSPEMRRLRQDIGRRTVNDQERAQIRDRMNALGECPPQQVATNKP